MKQIEDQTRRENVDRGIAVAAVLQAIPANVYIGFLVIVFGFIGLALFYGRDGLPVFVSTTLKVMLAVLIVCAVVGAVHVFRFISGVYHNASIQQTQRNIARATAERQLLLTEQQRLKNQQLLTRIQLEQQLPAIAQIAIERGLNFEYDGKGVIVTQLQQSIPSGYNHTQIPASFVEQLPEPYKMSDLLSNWTPTKDGILVGKNMNGLITIPAGESLCHTVFTGNTDAGKTNNERMMMIQLLYLEQICILCDRNFQRYRIDKKLNTTYNYEPIEQQLQYPVVTTANQALAMLKFIVSELDDRRIQRQKAIVHFPDWYLFMDELPAFCNEQPDIMHYVGRILREARQYGLFFIGAAQDLLNTTLKNDNGAIRDNLLTNFYGGGDDTTARLIMNLKNGEKLDETGLGVQGAVYIRAKGAKIERVKARTPLSDDPATQMLLSDMPVRQQLEMPVVESNATRVPTPDDGLSPDLQAVYNACEQLSDGGLKISSRNVEKITGINKDRANNLIQQLEMLGYVER